MPFLILAPVVRGQKGEYKDLFAELARAGYLRAHVNGQVVRLTDDLSLDRQIKHQIEVVVANIRSPRGRETADETGVASERPRNPTCAPGWPRRSSRPSNSVRGR